MDIFAFVDLDDTLFQTIRKCSPGRQITPMGFHKSGEALSFATDKQLELFTSLRRIATIIPTTARDLQSLRRVRLPFHHAVIAAHGGVILDPLGKLDSEWGHRVELSSRDSRGVLDKALVTCLAYVEEYCLDIRVRLVGDLGQPFYLVAKSPSHNLHDLNQLEMSVLACYSGQGFYLHKNDNNLALLPEWLNKSRAVEWVKERYLPPDALFIGIGDSVTDLPFMRTCDFMLVPINSQIDRIRLNDDLST
jgi:hydroxymethylpyrimidine pyrophosphatase-like HAD family hydrolase